LLLSSACTNDDLPAKQRAPDDSCTRYDGLGVAEVAGSAFEPQRVRVLRPTLLSICEDSPPALDVVLSTDASLSCAFPSGSGALPPGTYDVAAAALPATPSSGNVQLLFCAGGQYNSCGFEQPQSGSVTINTVTSPVTGAFSVSFHDLGADAGSFCAPICNPYP
jgi:hypothetical protein